MKLLKLKIKNFKGIKEFSLDTNGGNSISILGANGKGKTTIRDSFFWVFYDKNAEDKKDFSIKPLNFQGKPTTGVTENEVKVLIEHNGKKIKLTKVFCEKWTKKTGSIETKMTGHTTNYYIDDVPIKTKKEWDEFIQGICDEQIFKIVSNPSYFNSLPWKTRREIMLQMCGETQDEDILNTSDFEMLRDILNNTTTEKAQKLLAQKKSALNNELKEIPIRISEVQKQLPELDNPEELVLKKPMLEKQLAIEESKKSNPSAANMKEQEKIYKILEGKNKALNELKTKESNAKVEADRISFKKEEIQDSIRKKKDLLSSKGKLKESFQKQIDITEETLASLRGQWKQENARTFENTEMIVDVPKDNDSKCKACGQELPEELKKMKADKFKELYDKKIAEMKETFNKNKAANIAIIENQVPGLKQKIEDCKKAIKDLDTDLEPEIAALEKELLVPRTIPFYTSDIKTLEEEIQTLKAQINTISTENKPAENKPKIDFLKDELSKVNSMLSKKESYDKGKARVKELEAQQQKIASEYLALEQIVFDLERFIRTKMETQEEKLNSLFETVKFKLFNDLINGSVEDTFVTMVNGVNWEDLNGAAKINTGLEIIDKLSDFYNIRIPVFIDDAVVVSEIRPIKSQMIKLVVSKDDKVLRVEVDA